MNIVNLIRSIDKKADKEKPSPLTGDCVCNNRTESASRSEVSWIERSWQGVNWNNGQRKIQANNNNEIKC